MDQFDSKVVSFNRNASYLRERAMKNKRAGRDIDALELMRQAIEREPHNAEYRLEMAELCANLGLFEQADQTVTEILIAGDKKSECLYAMALVMYNRGEISRAERILRAYTQSEKPCERLEEARRLLDEIIIARDLGRADRKTRRAMRAVNRACAFMSAEQYEKSIALFERAIRLNDSAPEVHSLLALTYQLMGEREKAEGELNRSLSEASKRPDSLIRVKTINAQTLTAMDEKEEALTCLREIESLEAKENEAMLRLNAFAEAGLHECVNREAARLLKENPNDRQLLHMLSVSAVNLGLSDAAGGWNRILRLDPEDFVARYYLKKYNNGDSVRMRYHFMLPEDEVVRRAMKISGIMLEGADAMKRAWKEDEEFREILKREIYLKDNRFTRIALAALLGVDDEETRSIIRVYAERPDIPVSLRMYVHQGMKLMNYPRSEFLGEAFVYAGMPSEEEIMQSLSVAEKQMVRYAAEYVEDKYGDYPVADIALLWRAFMEKRAGLGDPVRRADAGSAALAMCYLNMHFHDDDIVTVSRWYGCSARQAAYIARLIRNSINSVEEPKE